MHRQIGNRWRVWAIPTVDHNILMALCCQQRQQVEQVDFNPSNPREILAYVDYFHFPGG
jgi:hypothetical protein